MINNCVITGRIKHYYIEDDCVVIMISHNHADGDFVLPIHTNFKDNDILTDYIEENALIGIKGHITLDRGGKTIVVADKISFMSSKVKKGENDESK